MAIEITLNNSDEFQDMIDKKDFTISKAVVETILANLNTRKKYEPIDIEDVEEEPLDEWAINRAQYYAGIKK